jgi:iron-sulfur cluster repair protein YtfE (RIC family)
MTENKFPAPPALPGNPPSRSTGEISASVASGKLSPNNLTINNRALFTCVSTRHELIAAYPELEQICTQLEFGPDKNLGEWSADLTATLLLFARAAQPPPLRPTFDWSQAEIFELITDLIDHHHCPLRNELRRLGLLIRNLEQAHPESRTFDLDGAFTQLEINLIMHLDQEEQIIFPHCLANEAWCLGPIDEKMEPEEVTSGIREMMSGHDYGAGELSHLLNYVDAAVHAVSDGDFAVIQFGLHAMAEDLIIHAEKERDILMPAAIFSEDLLRSKLKHAAEQRANSARSAMDLDS